MCCSRMGPGAHCKQVMVVLFALTKVGSSTKTAQTCTQQLQTFHQAKKYNGSPVKMKDMKLRRDISPSHLSSYDPRPVEFRNLPEYPDHFRNVWLNSTAQDLPIRQLNEPCDIRAVHRDHDYLKETPEE